MKYAYQEDVKAIHAPLSKEEQEELYLQMKDGDEEARERVIFSCLPLVINQAKKFRFNNKHIDLEDFIQEGNIALLKAVDNWDISKGRITTIATWYIRNALIDMINDASYMIKNPYSFSRRAAEELRRIKNVDSTDVSVIAEETNLSEKRVRKLTKVSPATQSRVGTQNINNEKFYTESEEVQLKPCFGDLIDLVNSTLSGDQKNIFCLWAGIDDKKKGVKEISNSLNKTPKYVYDKIKSAQRILKKAAKEVARDG